MPKKPVTYISNSGGNYEVYDDGHLVGVVGKVGRIWTARMADFDLGEHATRREAVEAMLDVYRT